MTYGCHNRAPYKPVVEMPGGHSFPFRMSWMCEYTKSELGQADKGCHGCKWRMGFRAGTLPFMPVPQGDPQALSDLTLTGMAFFADGKRVDPRDVLNPYGADNHTAKS